MTQRFSWNPRRRNRDETPSKLRDDGNRRFAYWLSLVQGVLTIIAILAGGWWFIQEGQGLTALNLELSARDVQLDQNWTLVEVTAKAQNVGKRPIVISRTKATLLRVVPLAGDIEKGLTNPNGPHVEFDEDGAAVIWPRLGVERDAATPLSIAVGENGEIVVDFVLPRYIKVVRIEVELDEDANQRSFIFRSGRDQLTWQAQLLYQLGEKGTKK